MDSNKEFVSPNFSSRPIILSPAPMDAPASSYAQDPLVNLQQSYQRNQSVGYNLQQEFEALKADLDLDLSYSNEGIIEANDRDSSSASINVHGNVSGSSTAPHNSGSTSRVLSGGPSLLSPISNASNGTNNFGLGLTLSDNLLRDRALSPGASNSGGLQALLNNKSTGFLPNLNSVPSRPQSVNDFSNLLPRLLAQPFSRVQPSSNFYLDMLTFTGWIETLSPQDLVAMLDYWCNNLPFDILLTMKSKFEAHMLQGSHQSTASFQNVPSYSLYQADYMPDMESMSLDDTLRNQLVMSTSSLVQPKPKANTFRSHLFADHKVQRPKLADPTVHNKVQPGVAQSQAGRTKSPTSHLYEKTNFLQLAAASSNSPHAYSPNQQMSNAPDDGFDLSATSKLGALATINSRVVLDSNRKNHQLGQNRHSALLYEELINRAGNSSSVPAPTTQKYSVAAMSGPSVSGLKKKEVESPVKATCTTPVGNSSMPNEIASMELLNNIPAWLKLLRLHKYTDFLKDIYWKDLVELNDQQLEDKGVKALGARRKLLKAFDTVKQARS